MAVAKRAEGPRRALLVNVEHKFLKGGQSNVLE